MRLLLCGGGTAGHIIPAIAVAEETKRLDPHAEILFIGREGGLENEHIIKSGFPQRTLRVYGLKRSISLDNITRVREAIKARAEAVKIIRDFRPDVILGTGGYVCWPVISAGRRLKIPTAIHESNVYPGLTTRLLSRKCDKVFLGCEETKNYLKRGVNTVTVGNPIRADFGKLSRKKERERIGVKDNELLIVSFGGSIGAEVMNRVIIDTMLEYSSKERGVKHLHATGRRYYEGIKEKLSKASLGGCKIIPYIENMPSALIAADIVICRCGSMTLAEIAEAGVASILIPSPNVTNNHQLKNAEHLERQSAATLIEEKNLSKERLIEELKRLKIDKNGRKTQAKNIKATSTPKAGEMIVNELVLLKKS